MNKHYNFVAMEKQKEVFIYMKGILWSVIFMMAFSSCSTGYKIEGSSSVLRLDGKMLFIKIPQGNQMIKIDSAEVIHGMFSMEGVVDSAVIASLYMDDERIMPFVVEDGDIRIQIDNAQMVVSGTPLNDKLYDFVKSKNVLEDRAYEVERMESRMIMDGKTEEEIAQEVEKEREKLSTELDELAKTFIQENYNNVLGPGVFLMLCNGFPYPVLTPVIEEIVNGAPDGFKNNHMVKGYMDVARENMKKLETSM